MRFEQRQKGSEGAGHVVVCGKSIPGSRNRPCKVLEVRTCLVGSRNSEEDVQTAQSK